ALVDAFAGSGTARGCVTPADMNRAGFCDYGKSSEPVLPRIARYTHCRCAPSPVRSVAEPVLEYLVGYRTHFHRADVARGYGCAARIGPDHAALVGWRCVRARNRIDRRAASLRQHRLRRAA